MVNAETGKQPMYKEKTAEVLTQMIIDHFN